MPNVQNTDSLPASFFARATNDVARGLLGQHLVRRDDVTGAELGRFEIVEVEAYTQDDPASHAFRGPSKRAAIMFGPAGHAYVYFIYGMYHCLNAVTEPDGVAGAVLIRGLRGLVSSSAAKQNQAPKLDGPGKLCRHLGINLSHNGCALFDSASPIYFAPRPTDAAPVADSDIVATPRIGITKAQDRLWRYILADAHTGKKR